MFKKGLKLMFSVIWLSTLGIILVTFLWSLFSLGRRLRIYGWRIWKINSIIWTQCIYGSIFYDNRWSLLGLSKINSEFDRFLRQTQFGLRISGAKIRLDPVKWRFNLIIDSLNIVLNPKAHHSSSPTKERSFSIWKLKIIKCLSQLLLRSISRILSIKISQFELILTNFPKEHFDYWISLQFSITDIEVFGNFSQKFNAREIMAYEIYVRVQDVSIIDHKISLKANGLECLNVPESICMASDKLFPAHDLKVSFEMVDINIWTSTIIFFISTIDQRSSSPSSPHPTNSVDNEDHLLNIFNLVRSIFPKRRTFSLLIGNIHAAAHLPESKPQNIRFESFNISFNNLKLHGCIDTSFTFPLMLLGTFSRGLMSSTDVPAFGSSFVSIIQKIFSQTMEPKENNSDNLLTINEGVISTCWEKNGIEDISGAKEMYKECVQKVIEKKPIWSINNERDNPKFKEFCNQLKVVAPTKYNRFSELDQPFASIELVPLEDTILASVKNISFDIPFEFPLNNLFDHLAFMVKAAQASLKNRVDRQAFYLFNSTWKLLIMSDKARFTVADDEFEVRLQKSFVLRRSLQRKFRRMDELFWNQCKTEVLDFQTAEDRWVAPNLRHLAASSGYPEVLRENPLFVNCYVKLQKKFFELYKILVNESPNYNDHPPLFSVVAESVRFEMFWDKNYLLDCKSSMGCFLNCIEGSDNITNEEVSELSVFLGGFGDLSSKNLKITIRDYSLPLAYAQAARIIGPLFIVEEPAYASAKSRTKIPVINKFKGKWNLLGLDEDAHIPVSRTILPTKLYHSLSINIFGDEATLIGFSPLFEGTFNCLDRAFELFSKPSEEISPFLPFWDKMRLLILGNTTSINTGPTKIICTVGLDLHGTDEFLSMAFPEGFVLGMDGSGFRLRLQRAVAYMNSKEESLLRWFHKNTGQNFSSSERSALNIPDKLAGQIPIVAFPKVEFIIRLEIAGNDNQPPISHNSVRICAASNLRGHIPDEFDSYKDFRIRSMTVSFSIKAHKEESKALLLGFYFREIEQFIIKGFTRIVSPPVKPGKLFQIGNLSKHATPKINSVLTEIKLQLSFNGIFCVRALQYYNPSEYGGLVLTADGLTRIWLAWRKSDHRDGNPNFGKWFHHFAEYDFCRLRLGVITSDATPTLVRRSEGLPITYRKTAIFDLLRAPRLFYLAINQICFKNDPNSSNSQLKIIQGRSSEIEKEIEQVSTSLRKCDPSSRMQEFSDIKTELGVLLEQSNFISSFLKNFSSANSLENLVSNHHFIIHKAQLLWHQQVRDAVFSLVDQQFQFFRCSLALQDEIFRIIAGAHKKDEIDGHSHSNLNSPASPAQKQTLDPNYIEELINLDHPIVVGPETESETKDSTIRREEYFVDPAHLRDYGMPVKMRLDVTFVTPQIILLDSTKYSGQAAMIITAQAASLKYSTLGVLSIEEGEHVGRRTKINLENAQIHVAFEEDFGPNQWPPLYPVDYLLTSDTETERFSRISEKVRATFVYDVSNDRFKYSKAASPVKKIFGEGDKLRVDANGFSLLTTSAQYSVIYDIIVNLLVYRDPTQEMRHEQLESLMIATKIVDQNQMLQTIGELQKSLKRNKEIFTNTLYRQLENGNWRLKDQENKFKEQYVQLKGSWDELGLIVDAMRTVKVSEEKLKQKQKRLLLDVSIGKIQWTLKQTETDYLCEVMLKNIHDSWLSSEDGSQTNLLELGSVLGKNLLPNAFYRTIISALPDKVRDAMYSCGHGYRGIGTQGNTIRFFLKALPPVGGILIIEHAEVNLSPLQVQLTYDIAGEVLKFFFPEKEGSKKLEGNGGSTESPSLSASPPSASPVPGEMATNLIQSIRSTASTFFTRFGDKLDDAEVQMMKARAANNCSFIYVNVPASQHLISYKGRGDTSITDVENFTLKLPDFEYHSQLWSWLEFTLQLRRDAMKVLFSNVGSLLKDKIKKLGQTSLPEAEESIAEATTSRLKLPNRPVQNDDSEEAQQEKKAKLLLGKFYRKQ